MRKLSLLLLFALFFTVQFCSSDEGKKEDTTVLPDTSEVTSDVIGDQSGKDVIDVKDVASDSSNDVNTDMIETTPEETDTTDTAIDSEEADEQTPDAGDATDATETEDTGQDTTVDTNDVSETEDTQADTQTPDTAEDTTNDTDSSEVQIKEATVYEIQNLPTSTECSESGVLKYDTYKLSNLIVTAPKHVEKKGSNGLDGYYVKGSEDYTEYNGIMIIVKSSENTDFKVGDVLNITGLYKEYYCMSEIEVESYEVTGTTDEPMPVEVSVDDIPYNDPISEKYEGMLVKISNVTVTNANPDAVNNKDYGQFVVDDKVYIGNEYKLPYMNPETDQRTVGDKFNYIIGILKYSYGKYVLMPRFESDMEISYKVETSVEEEKDVVEVSDTNEEVSEVEETSDTVTPSSYKIVINEIMKNPKGVSDSKGEWFEVYNAGDTPVKINGWQIKDTGSDSFTITSDTDIIIEPGTYFIFGINGDTETNGGVTVNYVYSNFSLGNGADEIIILDENGNEVDRVEYNDNDFPDPNGASMELKNPSLDNNDGANWDVSTTPYGDGTNKGTPGAQNSVYTAQ